VKKLFILLVAIVFVISSCSNKSKQFSELYNGNAQSVTKLDMVDGRSGKRYNTQDSTKIQEFLKIMELRSFSKEFIQSTRVGYLYFVDLYEGSNKTIRLTFGDDVQFDTIHYEIDMDITNNLDAYFESIKPE
jgi:hypothetical protein